MSDDRESDSPLPLTEAELNLLSHPKFAEAVERMAEKIISQRLDALSEKLKALTDRVKNAEARIQQEINRNTRIR